MDQVLAASGLSQQPADAVAPVARLQVRSILAGMGGYLPERIVTNAELAARVDAGQLAAVPFPTVAAPLPPGLPTAS